MHSFDPGSTADNDIPAAAVRPFYRAAYVCRSAAFLAATLLLSACPLRGGLGGQQSGSDGGPDSYPNDTPTIYKGAGQADPQPAPQPPVMPSGPGNHWPGLGNKF